MLVNAQPPKNVATPVSFSKLQAEYVDLRVQVGFMRDG